MTDEMHAPTGDQVIFAIEQISRRQRVDSVEEFHRRVATAFAAAFPETSSHPPRGAEIAKALLAFRALKESTPDEALEFAVRLRLNRLIPEDQLVRRVEEFRDHVGEFRSEIHQARTGSSYIAGVVRSLEMDQLHRWAKDRPEFDLGSAIASVDRLRSFRIVNTDALEHWGAEVIEHFNDTAVLQGNERMRLERRPPGMVSAAGSRSYARAWRDLLARAGAEILREAQDSPTSATFHSLSQMLDKPEMEVRQPSPRTNARLAAMRDIQFDLDQEQPDEEQPAFELASSSRRPASAWGLRLQNPADAKSVVTYELPGDFDDWQQLRNWIEVAAITLSDNGELSATLSQARGSARLKLEGVPSDALAKKLQAFIEAMRSRG